MIVTLAKCSAFVLLKNLHLCLNLYTVSPVVQDADNINVAVMVEHLLMVSIVNLALVNVANLKFSLPLWSQYSQI